MGSSFSSSPGHLHSSIYTLYCAKVTRPQKCIAVGLSHAFWRIPACVVLLRRQNLASLASGRDQTGATKMAQRRHNLRVFGLYRFLDYYPVLHGLCNREQQPDRKSTRLNSSHSSISYAVFCLKKKKKRHQGTNLEVAPGQLDREVL